MSLEAGILVIAAVLYGGGIGPGSLLGKERGPGLSIEGGTGRCRDGYCWRGPVCCRRARRRATACGQWAAEEYADHGRGLDTPCAHRVLRPFPTCETQRAR
jgi:hypothetical protein